MHREEMGILCVGKNAHNIRWKKDAYYAWAKATVGNAHGRNAHFTRVKKYYAWAKPLWECQREQMQILCVERNAHNIRGKTQAYYAWANPRWECPH